MTEDTAGVELRRTLTETYQPDGTRRIDYESEHHEFHVTARSGIPKQHTAQLLRKLASWLDQTPTPGGDDPWATDATPF